MAPASASEWSPDTQRAIDSDPELRAFLAMSAEASTEAREPPNAARYPDEYRSRPHASGAGYLVLVARELTGTS